MTTYKITHVESETNILYVQAKSADSALHIAGEVVDNGDFIEPVPQFSIVISCETVGSVKPSGHVYSIEDLESRK